MGAVGDVGVWAVGCGTIPTKGRLSGNEYFGYDSFQQSDSPPGPCKGLFGYLFIFCNKCLSSLLWDALPALSPKTLLAWPLDPGFWSPALSPVSQRQSYREPSPLPSPLQAAEGPPAAWLFLSQELSQGAGT